MNYYLMALKKFADFSGRSRRKEYWLFWLGNMIIAVILGFIEGITQLSTNSAQSILGTIFNFIILVPTLAVGVRRMHDVNKSGWFILVPIYNVILFCTPGDVGSNRFGEDPCQHEHSETGPAAASTFWTCPKCNHINPNEEPICKNCSYSLTEASDTNKE